MSKVFKMIPKWYLHLTNNTVLEDDMIFLHMQERTIAQKLGEEGTSLKNYAKITHLPTKSDTMVRSFHEWLGKYGNGGPWGKVPPYPAEMSRDEMLERYFSHTQHCKSCQGAFKNI